MDDKLYVKTLILQHKLIDKNNLNLIDWKLIANLKITPQDLNYEYYLQEDPA